MQYMYGLAGHMQQTQYLKTQSPQNPDNAII